MQCAEWETRLPFHLPSSSPHSAGAAAKFLSVLRERRWLEQPQKRQEQVKRDFHSVCHPPTLPSKTEPVLPLAFFSQH